MTVNFFDNSSPYPLSLPADAGEMLWWCGGLALSRHSHLFPERPIVVLAFTLLAQLVLRSYRSASVAPRLRTPPPHPKTFQLRTIAALHEPAGRPTHGLLSRRSTDRISTSLLANFAQLSMFRFDGLIIAMSIVYSNTY